MDMELYSKELRKGSACEEERAVSTDANSHLCRDAEGAEREGAERRRANGLKVKWSLDIAVAEESLALNLRS